MKSSEIKTYLNEKIGVKTSLVITLISIIMLTITLLGNHYEEETIEMLSFFTLVIQVPYGVILTFSLLRKKEKYFHLIPFLFLNWFIGCFSLNFPVNIFENLPFWVYGTTFLFCFSNFIIYNSIRNPYLAVISYFVNGFSSLLILYYAVFLTPISIISAIGILVLGLGFYGLVPGIVLIIHTIILSKTLFEYKNNLYAFFSGIGLVLITMLLFIAFLDAESKKINQFSVTKTFEENNEDLPNYIKVSQNLKPNFLNEILLKKDIVYVATDDFFEMGDFGSFRIHQQYNERKTHNPFLNIVYHFVENLNLSEDDQINILKFNFDKRLETEEQLWSGEDLTTKNIKEDVKIYPNERLAYTEITMDVVCNPKSWRQNEAIYSFQLPEGSVATSLSLWVNGVERKGVLTTKEKAKAAYNQIVGVEARDPSLMQWKEGNRVTVRVFPITNQLPRTFKCGFTTPLKVTDNKMTYESLTIKGPNISKASTISRIQVDGKTPFDASKDFEFEDNYYINDSKGLDKWEAKFPISKPPFTSAFVWKNKSYEVKPIVKQKIAFTPSEIILDLTNNWKIEDLERILNIPDKKFFAIFNTTKEEITRSNYEVIFNQFQELNYSLLPLFDLENNSLIITKSSTFSCNFEELEASHYLEKIKKSAKDKNIKVINISEEINPFWQTVKEQRYVDYYKTNINNCLNLIAKNNFIKFKTSPNRINVENAGISIQENPIIDNTAEKGSNHLYRMFCFGKVLNEQIEIQKDTLTQNKYVDLAKDANIVTPISSLIVLETDEDYKKNGIEKNIDTLGNASINNDGSVPEPHEWAMLIIGLSIIFFFYRKQKATN